MRWSRRICARAGYHLKARAAIMVMTVAIDIGEVQLVEADEKLAVIFAGIEAGYGARRLFQSI